MHGKSMRLVQLRLPRIEVVSVIDQYLCIVLGENRLTWSTVQLKTRWRRLLQTLIRLPNACCPQFQMESRKAPSNSNTKGPFVGAALRLAPVAVAEFDPVIVLCAVAVAVGAIPIGSGPVILTSPSAPPTRHANAYSFQTATLDRQELTFGYATIASYVCVVVEVTVDLTVPSVGNGTTS